MADRLAPDVTEEFRSFGREAPHECSGPVMDELRRLIPRGIVDRLALVGPAQGQETSDFMRALAQDVLPRVGDRPRAA
jgi:hypothetical protein